MSETPDPEVVELATKVFDLARRGEADALAAYVDAGVPVNLTNDRGDSLLMLAAYHGHAAVVTALVGRGADPDRANDRGQTPLAGAVFKGEDAVIEALLGRGRSGRRNALRPGHGPHVRQGRPAGTLRLPLTGYAVNVVAVAKWLGHHDVAGPAPGHRREAEEDGLHQAEDGGRPIMLLRGVVPTRHLELHSPGCVDSLM